MEPPSTPAPRPPSQDQVLARGVCLAALLYRGFIEQVIQFLDEPVLKHFQVQLVAKLNGWLKAQGFAAHLTRVEGESLARPFGSWTPEQIELRAVRCEELTILLWALGAADRLPRPGEPAALPDLEPILGLATDQLAAQDDGRARQFPRLDPAWLQSLQPRAADSVTAARRGADAWQWRAQLAATQMAGVPLPAGASYEAMIREGTKTAFDAHAIDEVLDEDFVLHGRPYATLGLEELRQAALIAEARQRALHWLCGYATEWDAVLK